MAKMSDRSAYLCLRAQIRNNRDLQMALLGQIWSLARSDKGYASIDEIEEFLRSCLTDANQPLVSSRRAVIKVLGYELSGLRWHSADHDDDFIRGFSLSVEGVCQLIHALRSREDNDSKELEAFESFDIKNERLKGYALLTLLEEVANSSHEQGWVSIVRFTEALREVMPTIRRLISVDTVIDLLLELGNFVSFDSYRRIGDKSLARVSESGFEFLMGPPPGKPEPLQLHDLCVYFSYSEQRTKEFLRLVEELSDQYDNCVPVIEIRKVVMKRFPVDATVTNTHWILIKRLIERKLLDTKYLNIGHPGPSKQKPGSRPRLHTVSLTSKGREYLKVTTE